MIGMLFTLETEEEQSSFEILYEKTCRRLLYIARGILHNESDAEEIVQDVYVKWAGDFDRYREKSVEEMLRLGVVMTRNACIDLMRRRKSHTEIPIELRDEIFTGEERGTFRGDILRVYYEFYNPELEDKELSLHSQIYLYYSGDEEGSEAGRYAFTLENYAGDRVYEVDKYTKVYLSYLSVYISSTKQISVNMEAVMENGQRKKVFKSGDSNSGEGVTEDGGKVLSARYDKTFSKLFPVDQVKELYLIHRKQLKEIKE